MVYEYSAMAIVFCKNMVLYTNESVKDVARTSLPKGHIEQGETHLQTAIRECMEETGVILKESDFFKELESFSYEFNNVFNDNKLTNKTIYPLIFKIDELRPINITEKNINFASYMQVDNLIEVATFDNIKELLKIAKKIANIE